MGSRLPACAPPILQSDRVLPRASPSQLRKGPRQLQCFMTSFCAGCAMIRTSVSSRAKRDSSVARPCHPRTCALSLPRVPRQPRQPLLVQPTYRSTVARVSSDSTEPTTASAEAEQDVIVVGAGVAGLTAAKYLQAQGMLPQSVLRTLHSSLCTLAWSKSLRYALHACDFSPCTVRALDQAL
jgi:hypothetical protein